MEFIASENGFEMTLILKGVDKKTINDCDFIRQTSLKILKEEGFKILGNLEHKFKPRGYTFIVLLSESHLAISTYPEYNTIYFHLYSCENRGKESFSEKIVKSFNPEESLIDIRNVCVNP